MKELQQNIDKKKATERAFVDIIKSGKKHSLYDKTVKLRKDYVSWLTGDGLDSFVRAYDRRETPDDKVARLKITKHILPRVIAKVRDSYFKALRNNNINIEIETGNLKQPETFTGLLSLFHQYDSLDEFWMTRYKELQFTDPNAWLLVDFYTLPDKSLKPYLREITSSMAINYKYENGSLQYLIFKDGNTYFYFSNEFVMKAERKDAQFKEEIQPDDFGNILYSRVSMDGYVITSAMYNYNEQFAIQCGYLRDTVDVNVFVSPVEKARPDIERLISQTSEYDINMILHVFLQKFEYADVCKHEGCRKGVMPDGTVCPECKGTGFQTNHDSAIDTMKMPLPHDVQEMIELSKMVHYVALPVEIVRLQKDEILYSINEIERAAINSDIFTRAEVAQTATEKNLEMQNVYDVLYPYAVKYCQTYQFIVEKCADILRINDQITVNYNVDKDMKLKSVTEQLSEIGEAINNNVPVYILNEMMDKLAQTEFRNDADALMKYRVKRKFSLTNGLSASEKTMMIAGLPNDNEIRIQVLFFEYIFTRCEIANPKFYDLEYENQKSMFDSVVTELKTMLNVPVQQVNYFE